MIYVWYNPYPCGTQPSNKNAEPSCLGFDAKNPMKPVNAWKKSDGAERYESLEKSLKAGNDTNCARANGGGTVSWKR